MKINKNINLTVFFNQDISLKLLDQIGILNRETAIYKIVAKHFNKTSIVTYGNNYDNKYKKLLKPLSICSLFWFPIFESTLLTLPQLLLFNSELIIQTTIFKTNQIPGCEIVLWLARHFNKKLIIRCGYIHSLFLIKKNYSEKTIRYFENLENKAFHQANVIFITSSLQKKYIVNKYGLSQDKVFVVPNYVMTNIFKPVLVKKKYDLVFIGRGSKQKNLINLVEALKILKDDGMNLKALLVGSCYQDLDSKNYIHSNDLNVKFTKEVKHEDLPKLLNQAKLFILPSLFEGHPKSLLEAMSCGLPCIGTNVPGIKEEINHRENGYLCKIDAKSISIAIKELISNVKLKKYIGYKARKYIVNNYNIDKIAELEIGLISKIIYD